MPNFMSELMRRANQPLLPQIGEGWDNIADLINNPDSGSSNVPLQTVKGGLAGMAHGVGQVASEATSPLGIIAMLAGAKLGGSSGGGGGLSQLGKYAEAAKGIKPNLPPEFTPVGDEPQRMAHMFMDPVEAAYGRLLARGGR
jgi:hypothetical protein